MKRFFLATTVIVTISTLFAEPQKATVRIYQDNGLKIVCQAAPQETALLTRKKNTTAIIFNGLANATASLANIIAGNSNKATQQAALSIISTVCNVTAQLADKEKRDDQTRSIAMTPFASICTDLTNTLLDTLDEEAIMRKPLPQTLSFLKNIPQESRSGVIEIILASSNHTFQFINELFSLAYEYLATCNNLFFEVLSDGVDDLSTIIDASSPL